MKCRFNSIVTNLICLLAVFVFNSCIFDSAGDKFYRTLWESDAETLVTLPAGEFTLEFLCGQAVSVKVAESPIISYGTYESDGCRAIIHGLTTSLEGKVVSFTDSVRDGDTMYLHCRMVGSCETYTLVMHRLSAYR